MLRAARQVAADTTAKFLLKFNFATPLPTVTVKNEIVQDPMDEEQIEEEPIARRGLRSLCTPLSELTASGALIGWRAEGAAGEEDEEEQKGGGRLGDAPWAAAGAAKPPPTHRIAYRAILLDRTLRALDVHEDDAAPPGVLQQFEGKTRRRMDLYYRPAHVCAACAMWCAQPSSLLASVEPLAPAPP